MDLIEERKGDQDATVLIGMVDKVDLNVINICAENGE